VRISSNPILDRQHGEFGDRARADAAGARRSALGSDPAAVDEQVALFVMIETATGMENAAEIASVPGVDGIFVGPADLALMMAAA
jgi:2-keto-3-deoxy-L-rhamnonate aldolase RhmA